MIAISLTGALLIGLAGGVHCIGMCSGIAGALRFASPAHTSHWPYTLSYNVGRLSSYTLAGVLAGALGQSFVHLLPATLPVLAIFSALLLLAMAAYLGQWWLGLRQLEKAGGRVWRKIQPWSAKFIPFRHPAAAIPYGMVWGWLPCGLVYSTLSFALASADAISGGLIMLCFGLGTLPALFAASSGAHWLAGALRHPIARQLVAVLLLVYALFLIIMVIDPLPGHMMHS